MGIRNSVGTRVGESSSSTEEPVGKLLYVCSHGVTYGRQI